MFATAALASRAASSQLVGDMAEDGQVCGIREGEGMKWKTTVGATRDSVVETVERRKRETEGIK